MRLTEEQQRGVREEVTRVFGDEALVRLFGSRVDPTKRGGDIGSHIEANGTPAELLDRELRLQARLMRRLGDRRIDVIVYARNSPLRSIDRHARDTGIKL